MSEKIKELTLIHRSLLRCLGVLSPGPVPASLPYSPSITAGNLGMQVTCFTYFQKFFLRTASDSDPNCRAFLRTASDSVPNCRALIIFPCLCSSGCRLHRSCQPLSAPALTRTGSICRAGCCWLAHRQLKGLLRRLMASMASVSARRLLCFTTKACYVLRWTIFRMM